jgi:hypothetical protein
MLALREFILETIIQTPMLQIDADSIYPQSQVLYNCVPGLKNEIYFLITFPYKNVAIKITTNNTIQMLK